MRCHLYAGQREQAGLRVPCRLMTLAVVDADATAAADDGDGPRRRRSPRRSVSCGGRPTPADSSPAPSTTVTPGRAARRRRPTRLRGPSTRAGRRRAATGCCAPRRVCCPSRRASSPRSKTRRPKAGTASLRGSGRRRRRRVSASTLGRFACSTFTLCSPSAAAPRLPPAGACARRDFATATVGSCGGWYSRPLTTASGGSLRSSSCASSAPRLAHRSPRIGRAPRAGSGGGGAATSWRSPSSAASSTANASTGG